VKDDCGNEQQQRQIQGSFTSFRMTAKTDNGKGQCRSFGCGFAFAQDDSFWRRL
jgi:hypothetical protein